MSGAKDGKTSNPAVVAPELQWRVEQFLYAEARMLDNREFERWFELLSDDVHYYMPVRAWVYEDQLRDGFDAGFGGANFDDDKQRMGYRVRKLLSGRDHVERPYSLLRHHISNVSIQPLACDGTWEVRSYFIVHRLRHRQARDIYSGERIDQLRVASNDLGFAIARRTIMLDETTLLGGGIGFLF